MARIGIYGGTFNPPHTGHISAAVAAVDALRLDKLLMIPTGVSPHKQLPAGSPTSRQRLEMVTLAAQADPRIIPCDIEIRREGPSYTYETVLQLKERYPEDTLILLMGTDMLLSFDSWRQPEIILQNAALGVFYRGEPGELEAIENKKQTLERVGAQIFLVKNPVIPISSTQLRRMLVFRCADPFLPEGVGEYIAKSRLYGAENDMRGLSVERLEEETVKLLKPQRVAHVLGCRDTAVALARHWGADETDAARAGLLHDITKALDGPLQLTLCGEYGILLDKFSAMNPKTLHALTGAAVAERIFGENEAVISAIRHHTTGKAGMSLLEKIIYVADYMEPNRNFPGVEQLRRLAFTDLDEALKLGLEMTLALLNKQGGEVSPESMEALEYLKDTFSERNR